MIDKIIPSAADAVADIFDGATVLVGGFGAAGSPVELVHALIKQGATNLTIVNNNAGSGRIGLAALIEAGRVAKVICSFPRTAGSDVFTRLYQQNLIELELVPQGTLAERIRARGAGIPAFYTPTSAGTLLAEGKEQRVIDGKACVLEYALKADFALIRSLRADRYGNLVYNKTARNFSPIMAAAATTTIVQAAEIVELGGIDAEQVVTPGLFVNRIVHVEHPVHEGELLERRAVYP